MRELPYVQTSVFVDERKSFGGNQLAVFPSPGKLTKLQMQKIAREINFSETTFVFPSKGKETAAKVRIFTPGDEIPFAGHPTLGTAFVLVSAMKGKRKKAKKIFLELDAGDIEIDIDYAGAKIKRLTMHQPLPDFGSALQNRGQVASALGIKTFEIVGGGVVSNGLDFLIVEANSTDAVKRARLNINEAVLVIERYGVNAIYLFARLESKKKNIHSRCFAPTLQVIEDPGLLDVEVCQTKIESR